MAYAQGTEVSPERSQQEIASTIRKYGADGFVSGWQGNQAMVEFMAHERRVRFIIELPSVASDFKTTPAGKLRPQSSWKPAMEAEIRRRWRALALVIKAKLEVVESGITEFESEFLANIVMPDGRTVAQHVVPRVAAAYELGKVDGNLLAIEASA